MAEIENVGLEKSEPEAVLLYPQEVADVMRVSRWTVYELVKRKMIPAVKIGRGIRIPSKAVREFIDCGGTNTLTGKEA